MISLTTNGLESIVLIGDKVLVKPRTEDDKTKSGLYLPAGYQEREPLLCGYVVKSGPGYPIPAIANDDEPWKSKHEDVKYVPLQPHEGDLALFLKNNAWEIQFNGEKYLIVPHNAILMLVRNDDLFK